MRAKTVSYTHLYCKTEGLLHDCGKRMDIIFAVTLSLFSVGMNSPVSYTHLDVLTDGYSSLVPRSSNHRCGELWNSLQIIIVFFSEKW